MIDEGPTAVAAHTHEQFLRKMEPGGFIDQILNGGPLQIVVEEPRTALWTIEESRRYLTKTFDQACRSWPDIMQPFEVMLADSPDDASKTEIMRTGLRSTISARFPLTHSV